MKKVCALWAFLLFATTTWAQDSLKIEKGNNCFPVIFNWEIDIYKRAISVKEKTLATKLEKIEAELQETKDEQSKGELQTKWLELKSDLKLIKVMGDRIGGEVLVGSFVDICKKYVVSEKEELPYWGLSTIATPKNRIDTDAGEVSIYFSTEVKEIAFNDKLIVHMKIVRNAYNEQIKEKTIDVTWTMQLQCDKEDYAKVNFIFSPGDNQELLEALNYEGATMGMYYDIDLPEANAKMLQSASEMIAKRSKN